jgi:hypothetical protein
MEKYEVWIRTHVAGSVRTLMFQADSFDHAEEQAEPYLEKDEFVWRIQMDFKVNNNVS